MKTVSASFDVKTPARLAVVNVTPDVRRAVGRAAVGQGIALLSVSHTTCGICVNEDEAGLKEDLERLAARLLEPLEQDEPFHHDRTDDNARAHLMSVLVGHSAVLPVSAGDLGLGTWQSLFLLEMDGPRSRRLDVTIIGE